MWGKRRNLTGFIGFSIGNFYAAVTRGIKSDLFNFNGVGIAGLAVDGAAGKNNIVALLQAQMLSGSRLGKMEHNIQRIEFLGKHGSNAPA